MNLSALTALVTPLPPSHASIDMWPGRENRTPTNYSELRRMDSRDPLRFGPKRTFEQAFGSGYSAGNLMGVLLTL